MAGGDSVLVLCDCGKRLKAPATAVGRRVRCPACGAAVSVGGTMTVAPPAPVAGARTAHKMAAVVSQPAGGADGGLDALYELAEQARSARPAAEQPRCPGCRSGLAADAVLCTNCGYDTRTGRSLAAATVDRPAKPARASGVAGRRGKVQVDHMAPQGSLMVGVAMSLAFAAAASVVWVLVATVTGFTIGYIAILIGWAAGAGMKVGQKGFSSAGGSAAAGVTLAAILLAKLATIELYLALHHGMVVPLSALTGPKAGFYFFNPIGVIIMLVGMGAAFRTANGSVSG